MRVNPSASCLNCDDGMGEPVEVTVEEDRKFTIYECVFCEFTWLRPHNY